MNTKGMVRRVANACGLLIEMCHRKRSRGCVFFWKMISLPNKNQSFHQQHLQQIQQQFLFLNLPINKREMSCWSGHGTKGATWIPGMVQIFELLIFLDQLQLIYQHLSPFVAHFWWPFWWRRLATFHHEYAQQLVQREVGSSWRSDLNDIIDEHGLDAEVPWYRQSRDGFF